MELDQWLAQRTGRLRGARLACVSAAEHRGLAVLRAPAELHVAAAPNAPLAAMPGLRIHRSRPLVPPGAHDTRESVPDMLAHAARCLPRLEALVVWESAIAHGLVSSNALQRVAWRGPAPRRLAREASAHSESLLETLVLHRLREAGIEPRQQVRLLGHRVDFLVGTDLVIQADGFEFHTAARREEDIRHDARLLLEGYRVIRLSYHQIVFAWAETLDLIRTALAQGAPGPLS